MSALHRRLATLHAQGMTGPAPGLFPDPRSGRVERFKPAAVLCAITDRPDPGLLLIHRPGTMRAHAGQVALPGGRIDLGEGVIDAAMREAQEELGIDPALVRVIGMGDTFHTGSGYEVTPVLATVPAGIAITPNPDEVADWFEAPLDYVLDRANHMIHAVEWEGELRYYVEITWQGHRIWGVTGAILANLAQRLGWHD